MAQDIRLILLLGQSNARGVNDGTATYPVLSVGDALAYESSVLKDFTNASSIMMTSALPSFLTANLELDPYTKYLAIQSAFDGSSLIAEPVFSNGDWSPTGLLRGGVKDIYDNLLIDLGAAYNVIGVDIIWMQGNADALYLQAGEPGFSQESYTDGLIELFDYFKTNISLDNFYVSELGFKTDGGAEPFYAVIRQAQLDACNITSSMYLAFTGEKYFAEYGWNLDNQHENQLGLNKVGHKVSEFINGEETKKYRESIYTEVIDIDDCVGYWKFNGDGDNEVIDGDPFILNGATSSEQGTLFDQQNQLNTNDNTGFLKLADHPFVHSSFTYAGWVKLDNALTTTAVWSDLTNSTGTGLFAQSPNFALYHQNPGNNIDITSGIVSDVDGSWGILVQTFDGTTHEIYLNSVLVLSVDKSWIFPTNGFSISRADGFGGAFPLVNGAELANFRMYNRRITSSEVVSLGNEVLPYNALNTPITPDTPTDGIVDNFNDTFTWSSTATTGDEISLNNGVDWLDAGVPVDGVNSYDVGNIDIPTGECQVRVAAAGVNPVSGVIASTEAFTEVDTIDYTEIHVYSRDIAGVDLRPISVQLVQCNVKYKDDLRVRREDTAQEVTPESVKGLAIFTLPDTDDMETGAEYEWRFADGCIFRSQVQKSASPVNFNALTGLYQKQRF